MDRICSFFPSATELVYALGLGSRLVGRSEHCTHPPAACRKPIVVRSQIASEKLTSSGIHKAVERIRRQGSHLYQIDLPLLKRLRPDGVITQELCSVCAASHPEVMEAIGRLSFRPKAVSISAGSIPELFQAIDVLGRVTRHRQEAEKLSRRLQSQWNEVARRAEEIEVKPTVWCAEWLNPTMVSGHWIPEMVAAAGGVDGLGLPGQDSRRVQWQEVCRYDPQVILVMPCSFSMERTRQEISLLTGRPGWKRLRAVKNNRVFIMEGSFFHQAGPRLIKGLQVMAGLFHPELFGQPSFRCAQVYES